MGIHVLPIILTLAFILFDLITGVVQAVANGELESGKMRSGLYHKLAFIFAMILGYLCEFACGYMELGFTIPLAIPVCVYICLTEIVSIIENIIKLNPELKDSKIWNLFKSAD
jgi:toxin secretion/phage lysis holin